MSNEKPLPTFSTGKPLAGPSSMPNGFGDARKMSKAFPSSTDLRKYLPHISPADGSDRPEREKEEDRYAFLRNKLHYEFMTQEDFEELDAIRPTDMMTAFVEVTSAHGVPEIYESRGAQIFFTIT